MTRDTCSIPSVAVRSLRESDRARWLQLYLAYIDFYEQSATTQHLDRLWSQLLDLDDTLACFVAVDNRDVALGLAHVRPFTRPLDGSKGLYLDDLFVDVSARGAGVGRAILEHLRKLAVEAGYSVVRWITADSNAAARALYGRAAVATHWVTYDMAPEPAKSAYETPLTSSDGA
ncbi:MAG: GNAT family N-acetyltransferase [Actinomycetota bacterium]|nr:GNAT family N-acetyltransferase [Actinomycetota bacterium]